MRFLSRLPLAARVAALSALMIAAVALGAGFYAVSQINARMAEIVEGQVRDRSIHMSRAAELALPGGKMERAGNTTGPVLRIRATAMPAQGDHSIVDHAADGSSLFVRDAATGDLIRFSSSVRDAQGNRVMGSRIPATSPIAQAVGRGEVLTDYITIGGIARIARYVPIITPDNRVLGAIGAGISQADADASAASMRSGVIIALALLAVLATVGVFFMLTVFLKPVREAADAINGLAEERHVDMTRHAGRQDEIGLIARAVEGLARSLAERAQMRAAEAERGTAEQARRTAMEKAVSQFDAAIGTVIDRVASRAVAVTGATGTVNAAGEAAEAGVRETVQATEETLHRVTGIAGATEELNAAIVEIRRQTEEAMNVSTEATQAVESAAADVSGLAAMGEKIGADPRHRRADQPAGAQRDHRGRPRGRGRQGLRGGRPGGQAARLADRPRHRGHRRPGRLHPAGDRPQRLLHGRHHRDGGAHAARQRCHLDGHRPAGPGDPGNRRQRGGDRLGGADRRRLHRHRVGAPQGDRLGRRRTERCRQGSRDRHCRPAPGGRRLPERGQGGLIRRTPRAHSGWPGPLPGHRRFEGGA